MKPGKFELCFRKDCRFDGVYSRHNLPKIIKHGVYLINFDEYADVGTHWIAFNHKNDQIIYFHSFRVEHVSKEIENFIGHKNIKANIFRIQ